MAENNLNQQTITFSGQSYKSLPLTGMNRIDTFFHASDGKVDWNSDQF